MTNPFTTNEYLGWNPDEKGKPHIFWLTERHTPMLDTTVDPPQVITADRAARTHSILFPPHIEEMKDAFDVIELKSRHRGPITETLKNTLHNLEFFYYHFDEDESLEELMRQYARLRHTHLNLVGGKVANSKDVIRGVMSLMGSYGKPVYQNMFKMAETYVLQDSDASMPSLLNAYQSTSELDVFCWTNGLFIALMTMMIEDVKYRFPSESDESQYSDKAKDELVSLYKSVIGYVDAEGLGVFQTIENVAEDILDTSWEEHSPRARSVTRDSLKETMIRQIIAMNFWRITLKTNPVKFIRHRLRHQFDYFVIPNKQKENADNSTE